MNGSGLSASSALSSWESKLFGLEGSPGHTPAADLRTSMDGCGASLQPLTVHVNTHVWEGAGQQAESMEGQSPDCPAVRRCG